jgi:hypothetical protein
MGPDRVDQHAGELHRVEVDGTGQSYKFRVKAFNAAGDSDWSNWGH